MSRKLPEKMRAITLYPEWCEAILTMGKRVENRTWVPPFEKRELIAIHAGKRKPSARDMRLMIETAQAMGCNVATRGSKVPTWSEKDMGMTRWISPSEIVRGAIVSVAEYGGCYTNNEWPWAADGMRHWRLSLVVPLPTPVPCRGRQGVWHVPSEILCQMEEQFPEPPYRDIHSLKVLTEQERQYLRGKAAQP